MNPLRALRPLREMFSFFRAYAISVIACALLFSSCVSKGPAFRNQPDYSTAYLGPNG